MSFKIFRVTQVILLALIIITCTTWFTSCQKDEDDFNTLAGWMTGSFSSEQQAAADTNFLDIRLQMVRIWTERSDGCWLYVEQAAAGSLDRPYRQRVYHVHPRDDDTFVSEVYTIADPLRFAGAWQDAAPLATLTPDSLEIRQGCEVILTRQPDGSFAGSTVADKCGSSLRGAAYATSEVQVFADRLVSWDRGYDAAGKQVWGATAGGYIFLRQNIAGIRDRS